MRQLFWKYLPWRIQRHLREDGHIYNERTFWETRAKQKVLQALSPVSGTEVCWDCRHAEILVKIGRERSRAGRVRELPQ